MSIAITEASGNASGWMKYVTGGGKEGDRVAAYSSDLGDPEAAVAAIEAEMSSHRGRKHQGFRLVQSFSMNELDPDDPETPSTVNMLGYELASRAAPNSACVVVTHLDSDGQNPHNHIYIVNHDYETGRAVNGAARTAFKLREVNDQLMRDRGMEVTEPGPRALTAMYAKQQQRGERVDQPRSVEGLTSGTWTEWMADRVDECLQDERVTDLDSLIEVAGEAGISIRTKQTAKDVKAGRPPSMTYALVDEDGNVRSKGKSKFACGQKKLGTDYSHAGLTATIDTLVKQRQEQQRQQQRPAQPDPARDIIGDGRAEFRRKFAAAFGTPPTPEPTPEPKQTAAEPEPVPAAEPPAPVTATETAPALDAAAEHRKHRRRAEDQEPKAPAPTPEPEPVDVDAAVQHVLRESPDAYVRAARQLKGKSRNSAHDVTVKALRSWAEKGALQRMEPDKAYRAAVRAYGEKLDKIVSARADRSWREVYGPGGTREGMMSRERFMAKKYDGPGSGRGSQRRDWMMKQLEAQKTTRSKERDTGMSL